MNEQNLMELDEDEGGPPYLTEIDAVSAAIGTRGFVDRYVITECVERFANASVTRQPERFDRFYWDAPGGHLLLDILPDFDADELERSRESKHVAFKTQWCKENGRRYLAVPESEAVNATRMQELLAGELDEPEAVTTGQSNRTTRTRTRKTPAKSKTPAKRGKVQRPAAAAK